MFDGYKKVTCGPNQCKGSRFIEYKVVASKGDGARQAGGSGHTCFGPEFRDISQYVSCLGDSSGIDAYRSCKKKNPLEIA